MNKNFYKQKLDEINQLVKKDFKKALQEINNELQMPYVPEDFEKKLIFIKNKITFKNNINEKQQNLSPQKMIEMLFAEENHQIIALSSLHEVNLREYQDILTKRINSWNEKDHYKKVILFEILVSQEIDLNVNVRNQIVNPTRNSIFNQEDVKNIFIEIDKLTVQKPQERELCKQEVNRYLINSFPNEIHNFTEIAQTIFMYVSKLINGDKNFSDLNQNILDLIREKDKV